MNAHATAAAISDRVAAISVTMQCAVPIGVPPATPGAIPAVRNLARELGDAIGDGRVAAALRAALPGTVQTSPLSLTCWPSLNIEGKPICGTPRMAMDCLNNNINSGGAIIKDWLLANPAMTKHVDPADWPSDHRLVTATFDFAETLPSLAGARP
ncbi:hypothetical protein [Actinoplanes sp. NPDC049316]|uniref:hypothetical protein n=1 Tax=Actinoplanes sp. NPDC049316 TaxID=3154727 RepID=UPI0034385107